MIFFMLHRDSLDINNAFVKLSQLSSCVNGISKQERLCIMQMMQIGGKKLSKSLRLAGS